MASRSQVRQDNASVVDTESEASSPSDILTPTTTISDCMAGLSIGQSSYPYAGGTFVIQNVRSKHVLTLKAGKVILAPHSTDRSVSIHWECVENAKGWTGFRNPISGNYLGSSDRGLRDGWKMGCESDEHDVHQRLVVTPVQNGFYALKIFDAKNESLRTLYQASNKSRPRIRAPTEPSSGGESWDFLRAD